MATTDYIDISAAVASLQARTDDGGSPVTDVTGEELRLYAGMLSEGVIQGDAFKVVPGAALSVNVGDTEKSDLAVVEGTFAGQGNYLVRVGGTLPHNVPLDAADLSNPRKDQIYLVVQDDAYDGSGLVFAQMALRTGTAAASPADPGPDPSWMAYLLLATISVPAGASSVSGGNISDARMRAKASFIIDAADIEGGYTASEIDDLLAGVAPLAHNHAGTDITSGEVPEARLPDGSTSQKGIVQLIDAMTSTSITRPPTASALRALYLQHNFDIANHTHPYLGLTATAADSDKLGGVGPGGYLRRNAADTVVSVIDFNAKPDFNAGLDVPGSGAVDMFWPGIQRLSDSAWGSLRLQGDNNYRVYFHTSTRYAKSNDQLIPVDRSWEALSLLKALTYDNEEGGRQIGFFAEDVQKAEPLTAPPPRDTERGKGEVPTYSEDGIIAHLVNVMPDILARLTALEAKKAKS